MHFRRIFACCALAKTNFCHIQREKGAPNSELREFPYPVNRQPQAQLFETFKTSPGLILVTTIEEFVHVPQCRSTWLTDFWVQKQRWKSGAKAEVMSVGGPFPRPPKKGGGSSMIPNVCA